MTRPFRLATLMKLRESARDERRAELAEAFRADQLLVDRIAEVDGQLAELTDAYRSATRPGRVNVDRIIDFHRQDLLLRAARVEHNRQRQQLSPEIERRREALVAADREVQVLEKLRERIAQREAHAEEVLAAKRLDEFAIGQTHRRGDDAKEGAWDA